MDECESKSSRVRYTREEILAVRKNPASLIGFSDEFSRLNASVMRSTRVRARPNSFSKTQGSEKTRDASNIVLGPQKRTWNTGCHVSQQPQGREVSDTNNFTRWPKYNSENRSYDKQHCKATNEYKREYRSNDIRSSARGRGSGRHADGVPFIKNHNREERHSHDRRVSCSYSDDEPEWFAEGPTTVNETIELGGILEETVECDLPRKCLEMENDFSQVDDSLVPSTNNCLENVFNNKTLEVGIHAFLEQSNKPTTNVVDQLVSDNQGSRFKHLFQKNEISDENRLPNNTYSNKSASLDNINEQLLRLLKGSCGSPSTRLTSEKNTGYALQVENKLRTILLGHGAANPANVEPVQSDFVESKPKVLTVEEIEAQLKLSQGDSIEINESVDLIVDPPNHYSDLINGQVTNSHGIPIGSSKNCNQIPHSETTCNLVPILQSLMIKKQQKSVYPQSTNPQNSHLPFGLVSNIMDNAVLSGPSTNQLQTPGIPLDLACDGDLPSNGYFRQLWNGTKDVASHPRPQLRPLVLCPDASRFQPVNTDSGPPRRPIVKAQQNIFSNYNPNEQAPNSTFNSPVQQYANHRLLDTNMKQFYLSSNESSNVNNSHESLSCSKQNYKNLLSFQSPSPSLASSITCNKNPYAQYPK